MNTEYITADKMREIKPTLESNVVEFIMRKCQECAAAGEDNYILQVISYTDAAVYFDTTEELRKLKYCIMPTEIMDLLLKLGYFVKYYRDQFGTETITVSWKQPEYIKLYESAY